MNYFTKKNYLLLFFLFIIAPLLHAIEVTDDLANLIQLDKPAQRIISLAPHVTENLFSAGANTQIIGTVNFSDYPEQAKNIPQVGGYNNINIEKIAALQPDLIIAWKEGNQKNQVDKLIALNFKVYINDPHRLEDVASDITRFGILSGNEAIANKASEKFLHRLAQLKNQYSKKKPISVFYQVWSNPLMTVSNKQIIGHIIELCSGQNIFSHLATETPKINIEAVIAANPQLIVASGMGQARPDWLDDWKKWQYLTAVQQDKLFFINPDIIQRHTVRILDGANKMCVAIENTRKPFNQ